MKKILFLIVFSLMPALLPAGGPAYDIMPADDPRIRYSGRVDFSDPQAPRFDWPGVSIAVRFEGRSVGFRLVDGANNYNLYVDGKPVTVWATKAGRTDYTITGLSKGEHTAVLSKRTEGYFGTAIFKGVLLAKGGGLLQAPPPPVRRIEFLGASWVCGYGVEGHSLKCPDLRPLENSDLAFGSVAARRLNAEWHTTAFSGRGVVRNYGDAKTESTEPFGVYFGRTLVNDPSSRWDFGEWVPDVVVINLGLNDFSSAPQPDPADFQAGYVALLKRVREAYPNAWIVSYNGTGWPDFVKYVHAAVDEYQKGGDKRLQDWEFAPYPVADNSCDYHPNARAQQALGEDLAARLAPLFEGGTPSTLPAPSPGASPARADAADKVWAPGVKREAFRYDFKGPLDETIWERGKYSLDDVGSYVQESEARDGADYLTLFVNRLKTAVGEHLFTGSGVMTHAFFGYGRFTVSMKSDIKPGTVSSFFLMNKWEPGHWFHKEIDIEFLGRDPKTVQFVVHRYYSDQGPQAMGKPYVYTLPFGYGDGFHEYSIHWTKDGVDWSVDGKKVWETAADIPDVPLNIFMNHWGPGPKEAWSASWVGPMDLDALPSKTEYRWVSYEPEE